MKVYDKISINLIFEVYKVNRLFIFFKSLKPTILHTHIHTERDQFTSVRTHIERETWCYKHM